MGFITCPDCDGTGKTISFSQGMTTIKCLLCKGTGKAKTLIDTGL